MTYSTTTVQYIRKLIRMRRRLNHELEGLKDVALTEKSCSFLEIHLDAYQYTNRQMAKFLVRNASHIVTIMPGSGAPTHKSLMRQYSRLRSQAIQHTSPQLSISNF